MEGLEKGGQGQQGHTGLHIGVQRKGSVFFHPPCCFLMQYGCASRWQQVTVFISELLNHSLNQFVEKHYNTQLLGDEHLILLLLCYKTKYKKALYSKM